jgi:hypothetical protein
MPQSIQPLSSAAFMSLIWEIDPNASAALGQSPINTETTEPTEPEVEMALGRFASALKFLREKVVPRVINSMNTSQITVIHRSEGAVAGDPLGVARSETPEEIYAVIAGPTTESLERGLLDVSDYEVLIPSFTLDAPLTEEDAIQIDSIYYDIVGIQAYPKVPEPIAYRYWCKRAA